MAYIPILAERLKIAYTLPIFLVGVVFYYLGVPIPWQAAMWEHGTVVVVTEVIVIISLMGAGLKIGLRYSFGHWRNPLRLIHTSMPLYMLVIFGIALFILQIDVASSILLAAVCAPTDPVLASDLELDEDELETNKNTGMRYLLTAEAGINDGLAFPFVFLAILWSKTMGHESVDLIHWLTFHMGYKIIVGVLIGGVLGYLYSLSIKKATHPQMTKVLSGFVGVALAFLAFALAEMAHGYGFLATFFAGLFAQYHKHTKGTSHVKDEIFVFNKELEKFLIVLWTAVFGGFLVSGILQMATLLHWGVALFLIMVLRPVTGRIGLTGTNFTEKKKWAIGFFGIKGVGSFFYLAYALKNGNFTDEGQLYVMVTLLVALSIVVHGASGPRVVAYFKRNNPG